MPRPSSHLDTRLVCPRGTDHTSELETPVTAPLLWQNTFLSSVSITPVRSGMLEMITVSADPAAGCCLGSGRAGVPCAHACAAVRTRRPKANASKPARGRTEGWELTPAWITLHPQMAAKEPARNGASGERNQAGGK